MKKLILFIAVSLFVLSANAEYLRGGFNGWDTSFEFSSGDSFIEYTFQYSGTTGSVGFKIDETGDWSNQWGGNVTAVVNTSKGKVTKGWGDASIDLTDTKHYTFKLGGESGWTDRDLIVFETDATPVSIVSVTDDSISATSDLTVTITLDANHTQDTVYLRYTTDSWSTSTFMKASKTADMTYQATISSIAESATVNYYVMTSSFPQATLESSPDEYFLKRNTNNGANYSYTAPTVTQLQDIKTAGFDVMVNHKSIRLALASDIAQYANVSVISLSGQLQSSRSYSLVSGQNNIDLPQTFNSGIYIVAVQMGETRLVKKVAIR